MPKVFLPDRNMSIEFPEGMSPEEIERQIYAHVYDQPVISEGREPELRDRVRAMVSDLIGPSDPGVGPLTREDREAFKPAPIQRKATAEQGEPEEFEGLPQNLLAYAPYFAIKGIQGLMGPALPALKELGMDTEGLLQAGAEYWQKRAPEIGKVPDIAVRFDKEGRLQFAPTETSIKELIGMTGEMAGAVAGPVRVALGAGELVARQAAKYARPFYRSILKGMVGGALLGEGKKDETLMNAALFGVFEPVAYAIGNMGNVAKAIRNSNAWRKATIRERGLMLQDVEGAIRGANPRVFKNLDDLIRENPDLTPGQIIRKFGRDPEIMRQARERFVGKGETAAARERGEIPPEPPPARPGPRPPRGPEPPRPGTAPREPIVPEPPPEMGLTVPTGRAARPEEPISLPERTALLQGEIAKALPPPSEPKAEKKTKPIETKHDKLLGHLIKTKGEPDAYFDKRLGPLRDKMGDEALSQYRERYPQGPAVLYKTEGEQGTVITPSAKQKDMWQVTYFDERGFSGDSQYKSEAEAFKEAYVEGYRVPDPERGARQMDSDKFIQGVLNAERIQREHRARMQVPPKPPKKPRAKAEPANIRQWIRQQGGVNPNDPTWKGELNDIRWDVKTAFSRLGTSVPAKGFPPGFWNKNARSLDDLTLRAIESGWLPENATEDDLMEAITRNSSKWVDSEIDSFTQKELEKEIERYEDELRMDLEDAGATPEQIERAIQAIRKGERPPATDPRSEEFDINLLFEPGRRYGEPGEIEDQQSLFGPPPEQQSFLTPESLTKHERAAQLEHEGMARRPARSGKKVVFPTTGIPEVIKGKQQSLFPEVEYEEGQLEIDFEPVEPAEKILGKPKSGIRLQARQRTRMATSGRLKTASLAVNSPAEVAGLLSHLRKEPQEQIYIVATDPKGTVLEIHRYTKGIKSASAIETVDIVGPALEHPDLGHLYYVHNHPSGDPTPSKQDAASAASIDLVLSPSGIGLTNVIVSGTEYAEFSLAGTVIERGKIPAQVKKHKIPVKERRFVPMQGPGQAITNPQDAIAKIQNDYGDAPGFLLLDNKLQEVGFLHLPPDDIKDLLPELVKAISKVNAKSAVLNIPYQIGSVGARDRYLAAITDVVKNIHSYEFQLHDIISNGKAIGPKAASIKSESNVYHKTIGEPPRIVAEASGDYGGPTITGAAEKIRDSGNERLIPKNDITWLRRVTDLPIWMAKSRPEYKLIQTVIDERYRNKNYIQHGYLKDMLGKWQQLDAAGKKRVGDILWKGDELQQVLTEKGLLKLRPEEREAYEATRQVLDFIWFQDRPQLMRELGYPETEIEEYRQHAGVKAGYMPRPRRGRYFARVKDKGSNDTLWRQHFEDILATMTRGRAGWRAPRIKKKLEDQFPGAIVELGENLRPVAEEAYFEVSPQACQELINAAIKRADLPEEQQSSFRSALSKATAEIFKVRGFMEHALGRKGIPGYDKSNWQDAVIGYVSGWAGFKSKMLAARKLWDEWPKVDWSDKPNLRAYAEKQIQDTFANADHIDRAADKARALLFYQFLGAVPKSALLQLSQNYVATIPRLTAETNWAATKITGEMLRAGQDLVKTIYTKPQPGMTRRQTAQAKRLTEEEIRGLTRARQNGIISDQLIEELMGVSLGRYGTVARGLSDVLRWMFGCCEIFNRETAYLTAFRIAKKQGKNFEQAAQFAEDIIDQVHFRYGKYNLPPFTRGPVGKVARPGYTFRSFAHNILSLYRALANEHGARGKYGLAKGLLALLAFAGVAGIPFYESIERLVTSKTGKNIRSEIAKTAGEYAKYIFYGLPALVGVDLTGSISIEVPRSLKEIGGVPVEWWDRTQQMLHDYRTKDYQRMLEDFPLMFQFLRGPIKAYRYMTRGLETRGGKVITDDDYTPIKMTPEEAARIATGFQPTRLSEHWRKGEARNQIKAYWEDKKDAIVSGYLKTLNTEGYESRRAEKWRDEITDFNMKRPAFVPPITAETIVQRRMDRPTLREGELKRQVQ